MKKKTKIVLWISGILSFLLLLALIFCLIFVSFDPKLKASPIAEMEYFTGARVVQNVLYRALKCKNPAEVRTLKLSNREMQSMMKIIENGDSLLYLITGAKPKFEDGKNEIYNISYNKGIYKFTVKLTDNFCGLCFVGRGEMKIFYGKGNPEIEFLTLKVGRFELPQILKDKLKEEIYAYWRNDRSFDVMRAAMIKIEYAPNGNVRIDYYPCRLRNYFKNMRF